LNIEPRPRDPLVTVRFLRLWAFGFFTFFTLFQLLPTMPFRIIELGGSTAQAGLFLAIYTYATAFSAPVTGAVADHFGRRRMLIIASFAFVVFSAIYGVVSHLPLLLGVAVFHGIFWSMIISSSGAILTEIVPESRRTEGFAYWGMASTAAVAIAPLAGLTIYRFGWKVLAAELTATSIVMLILSLFVKAGRGRSTRPFPGISRIVDWRVAVCALSLFVLAFSYGGITSYVAMLSIERNVNPPSLFFTVFALAILVSRFYTGRLGDRIGPARLFYPSVALVPPSLLLLAFASGRTTVVLAAILFGIGFGGAYPAFATFVLGLTGEERRGATFGAIIWAFDTGIGSGSLVMGWLVQHNGFRNAFLVAAAISLLSIPIFRMTAPLMLRQKAE
jgi:MFS family permease